jgi:hypothetical protein
MRRRLRPGRKPLAASAAVHVVAIGLAWWAQAYSPPEFQDFITYEITLVSPPPAQRAEEPQPVPEQEVVVETPEPVVEREPPPVVEERRREEQRPTPTPLRPLLRRSRRSRSREIRSPPGMWGVRT